MSANKKYKALRGMPDILSDKARIMNLLEGKIREIFSTGDFREIRTPILEETEVFTRSIGEDTDIVEKEMYSFQDRSGKSVSMRPEGTAAIIRACIEYGWVNEADIIKLFYYGPMFRGERPQKGRLRQFHQAGVEIIGGSSPYIDAEAILSLDRLFKSLKLQEYEILVNSLGCEKDRLKYEKDLSVYLANKENFLCDNCKRRSKTNVLRVLDCKQKGCKDVMKDAPVVVDFLCGSCLEKFVLVKDILNSSGIDFKEKKDLVRGLDYYTGVVFEVVSAALGSQDAIAAGGRYDNLCREMGGPDIGATGFAIGIERLMLLIDQDRYKEDMIPGVFVALMDHEFSGYGFKLVNKLRDNLIISEWDPTGRSFKAQMRKANRQNWKYVIILGENEMQTGELVLKDMVTGEQEKLALDQIIKKIKTEGKDDQNS